MIITDALETALLDLLHELRDADLPLILGGGYGLFLKQREVQESGVQLLLNSVPPLRSTNDLDLFLKAELLTDSSRLIPLRNALDKLGFEAIGSAKFYQFVKNFDFEARMWEIKVDFLAAPPNTQLFPHVKMDSRRIRPQPSVGIHAHRTNEAVAVEDEAQPITLSGFLSAGKEFKGDLSLPSTYAFMLMKLFALRDQADVESKGFGRKHALDLYTLAAIMTEEDLQQSFALRERYRDRPEAIEASRIARILFGDENSTGRLRLREHEFSPDSKSLTDFSEILREIFTSRHE